MVRTPLACSLAHQDARGAYHFFVGFGGKMFRPALFALALAVSLTAASAPVTRAQNQTVTGAPASTARNDYAKGENWLCRPGRKDACAIDLTTTIVAARGKLTRET